MHIQKLLTFYKMKQDKKESLPFGKPSILYYAFVLQRQVSSSSCCISSARFI